MNQYERQSVGSTTERQEQWVRWAGLAAAVSGAVWAVAFGVISFFLLDASEPSYFAYLDPVSFLLPFVGLPALYAVERRWFGRLAKIGFWVMAVGLVVGVVMNAVANYTPFDVAFVGSLLGSFLALIGAIPLGVAMVRTDGAPRLAGWLLITALPIGLPVTIGYSQAVAGIVAHPWAGPFVLYGLAWVLLGYRFWTGSDGTRMTSGHADIE